MGVVGAALRGFGRALKKNKIASKKTPDKSKVDLLKSEAKILTAKAKGVTKIAKDVKENPELFKAGKGFKEGRGKFGFNKPKFKKGGHVNTSRENRLEELGRVDSERAFSKKGKRNLKDEKKRIVRELK